MIERTHDLARIKAILTHPSIWPHIAPKGVDPQEWQPPEGCYYLMCEGGLFICHPGKYGMQIHANMLPGYRGEHAVKACEAAVQWMFEHTDAEYLYCSVPEDYPHVVEFAKRCGFAERGIESGKHILVRFKWDS